MNFYQALQPFPFMAYSYCVEMGPGQGHGTKPGATGCNIL